MYIFGFPIYTHYECWWILAISAGGILYTCQFQSNPRKLTRDKLLMKHIYRRKRVKTSNLKNPKFSGNTKTDFKSSHCFLICGHLHKDITLGCKYSVYIENK